MSTNQDPNVRGGDKTAKGGPVHDVGHGEEADVLQVGAEGGGEEGSCGQAPTALLRNSKKNIQRCQILLGFF